MQIKKDKISAIETIECLDEAIFKVSREGLSLAGVNPSKTIRAELKIAKSEFGEFQEQDVVATISVKPLIDVIKRCGDSLNISLKDNQMTITSDSKDRSQEFTIPLLTETEVPSVTLQFKKSIEFDATDLKNTIKDMSLISESFKIGVNEKDEVLLFSHSTNKSARVFLKPTKTGLEKYKEGQAEKVFSNYSNELMEHALKGSKISSKVIVSLGNNYPMQMQFQKDNIELKTIIAPRSEE